MDNRKNALAIGDKNVTDQKTCRSELSESVGMIVQSGPGVGCNLAPNEAARCLRQSRAEGKNERKVGSGPKVPLRDPRGILGIVFDHNLRGELNTRMMPREPAEGKQKSGQFASIVGACLSANEMAFTLKVHRAGTIEGDGERRTDDAKTPAS